MVAVADAREVICGALASAMEARETLPPDEWADRYRMVPEGVGDFGGHRWSTDRTPYAREPMRAYAHEDLRTLTLVFGSQTSKTEIVITCLLWQQYYDPCWALVGYPSAKFGGDVSTDRVIPSIEQSPAIMARTAGGRDSINTERVKFDGGGRLMFKGAGADAQAKGRPCRVVAGDEIVEFPVTFMDLVKERTKAAAHPKYIWASTPGNEDEDIDLEMKACQVHEHSVPCPHCHKYFALTFDLLKWGGEFEVVEEGVRKTVTKTGSRCMPEEAEATARIGCPSCGCECYEYHKGWMLERGVWLVEGEHAQLVGGRDAVGSHVDSPTGHVLPAREDGTPLVVIHNPQRKRIDRAFRLNSLYSSMMTWGRFVYDFAKNYNYTMEPKFVQGYLAQPWAPVGDKPQVEELKSICKASTYRLRTGGQRAGETVRAPLPEGVRLLTVGVDIQDDEVWVHAMGWGAHCQESFLVDFGPVPCPRGYDLASVLGPVLERTYKTVDGRTLKPAMMVVDSGFRTHDVYDFAMAYRGRNVFPVKGHSGNTRHKLVSPTQIEAYSDGRPRPHGVPMLNINVDAYKATVMGAIKASAAADDKVRQIANPGIDGTKAEDLGVNHRMRLPADCPETYRQHVTSERYQKKSSARLASAKYAVKSAYEWAKLPGRRNEGFDTTVYQFALVDFKKLGTLGRLQMDGLNERLVRPEMVAPPLAGLQEQMNRIRSMRSRRF